MVGGSPSPPPVVVGLWLGSPSSLLWSWVPVSPLKQIKTKNQKNPQKMEKQKTKNKTKTKKIRFFWSTNRCAWCRGAQGPILASYEGGHPQSIVFPRLLVACFVLLFKRGGQLLVVFGLGVVNERKQAATTRHHPTTCN